MSSRGEQQRRAAEESSRGEQQREQPEESSRGSSQRRAAEESSRGEEEEGMSSRIKQKTTHRGLGITSLHMLHICITAKYMFLIFNLFS